jgi:hypothetical protein
MQENEVRYFGYCQDESGRFGHYETLCGAEAAINYVLQYRDDYPSVIITDHRDCICLESVGGQIAFVSSDDYFQAASSCDDGKGTWAGILHQAAYLMRRFCRRKAELFTKGANT